MRFSVFLLLFWLFVQKATAQWTVPANLTANLVGSSSALFNKPVLNFSLIANETGKPVLKWQSAYGKETFFTIERSGNGERYEVIGVIKGSLEAGASLEFTDDAPMRGKVYYRVRIATENRVFVSEVVSMVISNDVSCRFYPNPVDKMLIVRSDFPVDIQVSDSWGKSFIVTHLEAGLRVLDVSSLEPGVYVVTLQQKNANKQMTERLVKK